MVSGMLYHLIWLLNLAGVCPLNSLQSLLWRWCLTQSLFFNSIHLIASEFTFVTYCFFYILYHLGGSKIKRPEGWYDLPGCGYHSFWSSRIASNTEKETKEFVQFTYIWEEILYEQSKQAFYCWGCGRVVWRGFCNACRKVHHRNFLLDYSSTQFQILMPRGICPFAYLCCPWFENLWLCLGSLFVLIFYAVFSMSNSYPMKPGEWVLFMKRWKKGDGSDCLRVFPFFGAFGTKEKGECKWHSEQPIVSWMLHDSSVELCAFSCSFFFLLIFRFVSKYIRDLVSSPCLLRTQFSLRFGSVLHILLFVSKNFIYEKKKFESLVDRGVSINHQF